MRRMLEWFRRKHDPEGETAEMRAALYRLSRQTRNLNVDTSHQWQRLESRLQAVQHVKHQVEQSYRRSWAFKPALAIGAAAAVLMTAGVWWLNMRPDLSYHTGKGQQSTVILSDSTKVKLNYMSELTVESGARRVKLKGEAFFTVSKNGTPFTVSTDVGTVRVLGTEFNVHVRDGRMVVGVIQGRVQVLAHRANADSAVILERGQITTCLDDGYPGSPAELPFADYPGWTHDKFFFYRSSLRTACNEIASKFDIDVRVERKGSFDTARTLTGVVDASNPAAALSTLSTLTGLKYRHEKNGFILY